MDVVYCNFCLVLLELIRCQDLFSGKNNNNRYKLSQKPGLHIAFIECLIVLVLHMQILAKSAEFQMQRVNWRGVNEISSK